MIGRNIVASVVLVLAVFAAACSGGPTAPTPTPTPGIISSITLAQVQQVDPPVPPSGALSYVYGVDTVTAHFSIVIKPSDMGPNLMVMACLGVDTESYVSGACKGKGTGALSSGMVEGVTLDPAYATGRSRITSTAYVHVYVISATVSQLNAFAASLTAAERDRVPIEKLRASGMLLSEPTYAPEPIDWKMQ